MGLMSEILRYTTHAGFHPSIQVNDIRELPMARWLLALERALAFVESGVSLVLDDSDEIGDKHTRCNWGMCGDEAAVWPDAQDHIWPLQFEREGRVAPLDRPEGQRCPLDMRPNGEKHGNGCFYSCKMFQAKSRAARPTREQTVQLYRARIADVREAKP